MRTLKILAVVLVALALGAAAVWLYIGHAADRKWAAVQERIRQLSADHPVVLPPMPSTPASKEIQIHFVAAIREAVRRNSRARDASRLIQSPQGDPTVDGVLEDARDFLDQLHRGARACAASPGDFPPGWRGEWDRDTLLFVMRCSVLRARQARERKEPSEAAEVLLDALQLARFWASSGKGENRNEALFGLSLPLEELRIVLSQETLSRDSLLRLERELEPLDHAIPSAFDSLQPFLARWGEGLGSLNVKEVVPMNMVAYRWRYFLPETLMKAQAFEDSDRHAQWLLACVGKPYSETAHRKQQIGMEMDETKNPLMLWTYPFWRLEWIAFNRTAQVRLLRIAARYRATGEFLALKDPFGGEFLHARTDTRLKFWSLGEDGRDDRGDGSHGRWYASPITGTAAPKDIVIEVDHPKPE